MRFVEALNARLSVIGLGTWQFGSREWGYGSDYAEKTALELVQRASELGINLIDTAEMYGRGNSERICGRAIASDRASYFIGTKFTPLLPLPAVAITHGYKSASRLGVQEIDLYQMHWPNPAFPISMQIRAMGTLLERGLIKNVGVSNYSLSQWLRAERALGHPILSNQVHYSLLSRKPDLELVPYAQANSRVIIAYSPLEQGALTGKYGVHSKKTGVRRVNKFLRPQGIAKAAPLMEEMVKIADEMSATVSQVALAWLVTQPNVVAIPGASAIRQLEMNAASADFELSDKQWETLASYRPF